MTFLPALSDEFNLDYGELGILSLTFTLLSGVLQPILGHRADRYGQRRLIVSVGFWRVPVELFSAFRALCQL